MAGDPTTHQLLLGRLASPARLMSGSERVRSLTEIEQLRGWLAGREAEILAVCHDERDDIDGGARDITQLSQQEANVSYGQAKRRSLRAMWLPELPTTRSSLAEGRIGTEHVDQLCSLAERLRADDRAAFEQAEADLVADIAGLTPRQTQRRLAEFERSLDDDEGKRRAERQREANSLRFAKKTDGTIGVHGSLDPVSGTRVRTAVDAKVTEMWRREGKSRDGIEPPHSVMTNERRRAEALVELVRAGATATGVAGAQVVVLIDHQTLLGQLSASPTARLAGATTLPAAEARRLGGRTDLDNLAPLCSKHHHLVHNDGWDLTLDPERVGRLTRRADASTGAVRRSPKASAASDAAGRDRPRRPDPRWSSNPPPRRPVDVPMRC